MKDSMILEHVYKSYGAQVIFKDFSYTFKDKGGYLLFGPSGSGKTTLINILAGLENIDKGHYYFDNEEILEKQQRDKLFLKIAYIAQDTYLIDYLTVRENLELSCVNKEALDTYIQEFQLHDIMNDFPNTLSGGERQRIAIIRALCLGVKVFIADEPTASLDEHNKIMIFDILHKLSKDMLIICVSHDIVSKQYFHNIIDFHELELYTKSNHTARLTQTSRTCLPYRDIKPRNYIMKQKRKDEKFSKRLLSVIFCICFLLLSFSLYPIEKIKDSLYHVYDLNYLVLNIPRANLKLPAKIKKDYGITNLVYTYNTGANYMKLPEKDVVVGEDTPYANSLVYDTLPLGKAFKYYDHLAYGHYFTQKNQIMLGYDKAKEFGMDSKSLIGSSMVIDTPNGAETFEIAGIFKPFGEKEFPYLTYGYRTDSINDNVFFNDAYTDVYLHDHKYSQMENATSKKSFYIAYFSSNKSLLKFQKKYDKYTLNDTNQISIKPIEESFLNTMYTFEAASAFFLPISVLSFLLAIAFYLFSKFAHMHRTRRNLSVFHSYGIPWRSVYVSYCAYFMLQVCKCMIASLVLFYLLAFSFNTLNAYLMIVPFTLFTMDVSLFLTVSSMLFLLISICICAMMFCFRKHKWFHILKMGRDLL